VPSEYASAANAAGLDIITWTIERSGLLETGGGYYYQSVAPAIDNDGDMYQVLDVLATKVGIRGIFSDWPATVTTTPTAGACEPPLKYASAEAHRLIRPAEYRTCVLARHMLWGGPCASWAWARAAI